MFWRFLYIIWYHVTTGSKCHWTIEKFKRFLIRHHPAKLGAYRFHGSRDIIFVTFLMIHWFTSICSIASAMLDWKKIPRGQKLPPWKMLKITYWKRTWRKWISNNRDTIAIEKGLGKNSFRIRLGNLFKKSDSKLL